MILIDAGPLVALIHRDDDAHESCKEALKKIRQPLLTVGPAVVEAMYLLGFSWQAQDALWEMLTSGAVRLADLDEQDFPRMRELMKTYRNLPMDFADAALVRVGEREGMHDIFTLDRRDFGTYRMQRGKRFNIIP
jgi:uncharacterized protein